MTQITPWNSELSLDVVNKLANSNEGGKTHLETPQSINQS